MQARCNAVLVFATILLLGCGSNDDPVQPGVQADACEPDEPLLACGRQLNIAHRGGAKLAPENTLVAFENAVALEVDALKLDVHSTSDGVIVVMHDDDVKRTTDGSGPIHDLSYRELLELDAGYDFSSDGGKTHPYRGKGVVVPTLSEVLHAFPDQPVVIEIKQSSPSIVEPVLDVLYEEKAVDRVVLASVYDDALKKLREAEPTLLTSMGVGEIATFVGLVDDNEADYVAPAPIIQPPASLVKADFMARADRKGIAVHGWTVNGTTEMNRLLDLNIHGIITDNPVTLGQVLADRAAAQ